MVEAAPEGPNLGDLYTRLAKETEQGNHKNSVEICDKSNFIIIYLFSHRYGS
jgi:hypothetical protein